MVKDGRLVLRVLTDDLLVDAITVSVSISVRFVSTLCLILGLTTGSTRSTVALTVPATLPVREALGVGVGGEQISARVMKFGPRSSRNFKSFSDSRRLQQPSEPEEEPWPSKLYPNRPSFTGTGHSAFCLEERHSTHTGVSISENMFLWEKFVYIKLAGYLCVVFIEESVRQSYILIQIYLGLDAQCSPAKCIAKLG